MTTKRPCPTRALPLAPHTADQLAAQAAAIARALRGDDPATAAGLEAVAAAAEALRDRLSALLARPGVADALRCAPPPRRRLDEAEAAAIKRRLIEGCRQADVARAHRVSRQAVYLIASGRTWTRPEEGA